MEASGDGDSQADSELGPCPSPPAPAPSAWGLPPNQPRAVTKDRAASEGKGKPALRLTLCLNSCSWVSCVLWDPTSLHVSHGHWVLPLATQQAPRHLPGRLSVPPGVTFAAFLMSLMPGCSDPSPPARSNPIGSPGALPPTPPLHPLMTSAPSPCLQQRGRLLLAP